MLSVIRMPQQTIKSFEDLEVWKNSRKLRKQISILAKSLPKEEKYRLTDQLIRASRSVTANNAEGYGRFHYQENIQFCRQARGSLYEIIDHLTCALDEGYIDKNRFDEFKKEITLCVKLLNGFISYLKKAKKDNTVNEPVTLYRADPPNDQ